jgi:hypothetical protein
MMNVMSDLLDSICNNYDKIKNLGLLFESEIISTMVKSHDFIDDIAWLDPKYKIMHTDFSCYQYPLGTPNFHMGFADSILFAQQWEKRLFAEGFLNEKS